MPRLGCDISAMIKQNVLFYWEWAFPLLTMGLLFAFVACAAPAPVSTIETECAPACPVDIQPEPVVVTPDRIAPSDRIPRITIAELKQKMESKANILIVDNRHKEEYDVDHIKDAVSAPLSAILAGEWKPPLDKELVFY